MSDSDEDPKVNPEPDSDSDDEKPTASTRSAYDPAFAGRDAPYTRDYKYYKGSLKSKRIDDNVVSALDSRIFKTAMLKKMKKGGSSSNSTPRPESKRSTSSTPRPEHKASAKKAKREDRKRKKDGGDSTDYKKYRMISSPSSSDSEDDKPLVPAAPTKPAILDLTSNGGAVTPRLLASSGDESKRSSNDGERRRKGKKGAKEKDDRSKSEKGERKKKDDQKSNHQSSPSKSRVVDLFAGMEAAGNSKRERRQKTYSDPNRISVVGWSNDRILSHFKAFSHCYVNPLPKDELQDLLGAGFDNDGNSSRRKKDRDRKKEKKREPIYNGDGSPVRAVIDSDAEEGDVVLPKREKKEKKRPVLAESRKCEECGQIFSLNDEATPSKTSVWCSKECIQARAAKAFEVIEDHSSKVAVMRTDGQMITDGPAVSNLEFFLLQYPEYVPMLPEKLEPPKPPPSAAKPPKVISKSSDTVRVGVKRAIGDALHTRVKQTIGCMFRIKECKEMAERLEFELFNVHGQNAFHREYKGWFASFVKVVKTPQNKGFFHRIMAGLISPQRAVTLDEKAMMSEEYAAPVPTAAPSSSSNLPAAAAAAADGGGDDILMEDASLPSTSAVPKPINAMAIKRIPKLPPGAAKPMASALDSILGDGKQNTTAQHNSHFYDANCNICAAKTKAVADKAQREEAEKQKARDRREEQYRKMREADKQRARELSQKPKIEERSPSPGYGGGGGFDDDDYGGGGGGSPFRNRSRSPGRPSIPQRFGMKGRERGGDGRRSRSRSRERGRDGRDGGRKRWSVARRDRSPSVEDPWKTRSPLIWRGELSMISNITLITLRAVSNTAAFALREFLPTDMKVKGRIQHLSFFDYLLTVRTGNVKDIVVFEAIKPDTTTLETEFNKLVDDMNNTKRYLVVNLDNCDVVKDGYLVPVARDEDVPAVLLPWAGPGIPPREDRRDMLLLVVTLHSKWVGPLPPPPPQLPPMSSFAEAAEERLRRVHEAQALQKRRAEEGAYSPAQEYRREGGPGGRRSSYSPPPHPSLYGPPGRTPPGPPPLAAYHHPGGGLPPPSALWADEYEQKPELLPRPPSNLAYGAAAEEDEGTTGCDSLLPPAFFELSRRAAEVRPDEDDVVPEIRTLEDFLLLLNSSSKPARVKKIVNDYIHNPDLPEADREIAKNAVMEKIKAEKRKKEEEARAREPEGGGSESRPASNGTAVDNATTTAAVAAEEANATPSRDRPFSPSDFDKEDVSFVNQASSILNSLRKDSNSNDNSMDSSLGGFEGINGNGGASTMRVPQPVPPPVLPPGMSLPVSVPLPPQPPAPASDADAPPPPPPPAESSLLPPPPPPPAMPSGVPQPVPPPAFSSMMPVGLLPPPPPPPPPQQQQQPASSAASHIMMGGLPMPPNYSLPPPGMQQHNLAMPPPLFGLQQQQQMQQQQQHNYGMPPPLSESNYGMPPPLTMPPPMMNMQPPQQQQQQFGMPPPGHMGMPQPPMMGGGEFGDHSMMQHDESMEEEDSGPLLRMGSACPAPIDMSDIYGPPQTAARHGSAGFGSQLPPSMGGPVRASTPELVARALEIKPLPQRQEERKRLEIPDNAADFAQFFKEKKDDLLSNEGFMGDPTIKPLPRAAQERIQRMLRQQEMEEERERRMEQGEQLQQMARRARGGVKHRERQQKKEQQQRERATIELSKRMGVYEQPLPGAPFQREMRPPSLMAVKADPPPGFEGRSARNFDDDCYYDEQMRGGGGDGYEGEEGPSGYGNGRMEEGGDGPSHDDVDSSMDVSMDKGDDGGRESGELHEERDTQPNAASLLLPPPPPPPPPPPIEGGTGGGGTMLPPGTLPGPLPPPLGAPFRGGRGGGGPPPAFRGGRGGGPPPLFRGGFDGYDEGGGFEERFEGWNEERGGGGWNGNNEERGWNGGGEDRGWNNGCEERGWNEDRGGWNGNGGGQWEDDDGGFYGGGGPPRPLMPEFAGPPRGRGGRGGGGPSPRGGRGRGGGPRGGGGRGGGGGPPPWRGGGGGGRGGPQGGFRGGPPPFRGGPPRGRGGGPPPFRGGGW